MKRLFATTVFVGALAFLLVMSAHAAVAQDIEITSVDNYAGNAIVHTNRANTTVTITEVGGEHRQWIRTTDSDGKCTIKNTNVLSKDYLKISEGAKSPESFAGGVVAPDNIYDQQPFSFAVTGSGSQQTVSGEVVNVQTASGEVVERVPADKYGRVFLARGLPAGAYLISRATSGGHQGQPVGKIEIKQRLSDALERPWEHPPQPMQLQNAPQALKLNDPLNMTGHGFNPDCANMQVSLSAAGQTQSIPVLAATEDQLKVAPVTQVQPGLKQLTITNTATGQSIEHRQLLLYDIQGQLKRNELSSGNDQTQLVVTVAPKDPSERVKASVVSGPVDFGGGRKESEAVTNHGEAVFPVHAERGAGPFQLRWELAPQTAVDTGCPDQDDPADLTDAQLVSKRQELNRQKDQDYRDHDGKPGPKSAALWCQIKRIEQELRDRGLTIDSEGNVHTPPYYKGTSGLEPGHSYPPR